MAASQTFSQSRRWRTWAEELPFIVKRGPDVGKCVELGGKRNAKGEVWLCVASAWSTVNIRREESGWFDGAFGC